jgi:hypothetical protein
MTAEPAIAVMADLRKPYDFGHPESQGGFAWWLAAYTPPIWVWNAV